MVINPDEAKIIQRIFEAYASGQSPRSIVAALNAEGVPPPRRSGKSSGAWSFSTLFGNWKRGTGVINNEIYIGKRVWNRQRFKKDPDTTTRRARLNPPEAWVVTEVPDMRIIDDALWDKVKVRQAKLREEVFEKRKAGQTPGTETARRPSYLLSGLLECGDCGSGYSMINQERMGCSAARNKGTCSNRRTLKRTDLEERVLSGLKSRLMAPDLVQAFAQSYTEELNTARKSASARRAQMESDLAKTNRQIENLVEAITEGMFHTSMKEKMSALETYKAGLEAQLSATPDPDPILLHPRLADVYSEKIRQLIATLNDPALRLEATEIILIPYDHDGYTIDLRGDLAGLLNMALGPEMSQGQGIEDVLQFKLVAGVGFEPTTFRL